MAKVTKDTMIGELLQIDENVAPMLLKMMQLHRFHVSKRSAEFQHSFLI